MNGYKRIRNIENDGKMVLPFIDLELAMKIKALDVNILEYQMADILSKKERKALTARIKSVKKVIEKQLAYEEKLRSKGVKFNSRFVNSKTDRRAWDKAMQIYNQKMDKLKQKNPDYAKGYIEGTTYLWGNVVLG
jgi:chromosome segregation ATPase